MKPKSVLPARYALLGLAAALTAIGLFRQEHLEVRHKAVKLFLDCIGIG